MPQHKHETKIRCIHGWTSPSVSYLGVPLSSFIQNMCEPADEWQYMRLIGADGYEAVLLR